MNLHKIYNKLSCKLFNHKKENNIFFILNNIQI